MHEGSIQEREILATCPADDHRAIPLDLLNLPSVICRAPQEAVNDVPGGFAAGIKEVSSIQLFSCIYSGSCGFNRTMCLAGTQVMQRQGQSQFHRMKWQTGWWTVSSGPQQGNCGYNSSRINTHANQGNKSFFSQFSSRFWVWWQKIRFDFLILFLIRNLSLSKNPYMPMSSHTLWDSSGLNSVQNRK